MVTFRRTSIIFYKKKKISNKIYKINTKYLQYKKMYNKLYIYKMNKLFLCLCKFYVQQMLINPKYS